MDRDQSSSWRDLTAALGEPVTLDLDLVPSRPDLEQPSLTVTWDREALGRVVRQAWIGYCRATGDTKRSHLESWEEMSDWEREADRVIGAAVADALLAPLVDGQSMVIAIGPLGDRQ